MIMIRQYIILSCISIVCYSGVTKNKDEPHTSEFRDNDRKHEPHFKDGVHNVEFDNEAFLGSDFSKNKESLQSIFAKIDVDEDGKISSEELVVWLQRVSYKTLRDDIEGIWKGHSLDKDSKLTWAMHEKDLFGENGEYADEDEKMRTEVKEKDQRRWKLADKDGDNELDFEEALSFFHPETDPAMRDYIIEEVIQEIDKDGDGFVNEEEFIDDLWPHKSDEKEPEWIAEERQQFKLQRDKNGDGKLDTEEIADWVLPKEHDRFKAEAEHLLAQADEDEDGQLSLSEVLSKSHVFAGSEVTSFGELLGNHDEL